MLNVEDHVASALLIATNPSLPAQSTLIPNRLQMENRRGGGVRTSPECNPLRARSDPVRDPRLADGVVERDHAGHGGPPVLAEPPLRAAAPGTRTCTPVGRACIRAGEAEARENGRRAVRVREREDVRERVRVGRGLAVQVAGVLRMRRGLEDRDDGW